MWNYENQSKKIRISGGSVIINSNPNLCPKEITKFLQHLDYNRADDKIEESNGYLAVCDFHIFNSSYKVHSPYDVTISWEPYIPIVGYKVVEYKLFNLESRNRNHHYLKILDTCAK